MECREKESQMHKMKWYLLTLSLILGCFGPFALGQRDYAAVHGTVTDTTGAVIPDATVTILNNGTGISSVAKADKNGYYIFPQLQVGLNYSVKVTVPGFENFEATGLTLNVNDNREVDAKLKVGTAAQTVEVSATAVQVETSNTQLQQIETAVDLEEIPLEGRDPAGLQKLEPGVVESSDRFGSFSSNGNQTPQNNYVLNGIDINDGPLQNEGIQINPDALVEENIVTSTMNPEFSRNSGAVVNQVLKSGSNQLHGSGFEFYRDTFLNNGNYFSTIRPVFHQNLYGGTLGGPILKNKLFFFAAYQGFRNRTAETDQPETLNSDQFSGNFTADTNYFTGAPDSAGLTKNPIPFAIGSCPKGEAWNKCFAPNSAGDTTVNIPTAMWNSLASKLISTYVPPATETIGGQAYYTFNALSTAAQDQGILRFDYTPRAQDAIWASSVFQSSPSNNATSFGGGSYPGFGQHAAEHFKLFSASYTHTFTSNKLNELRGGYYRLNFPAVIPTPVQDPSTLGFSINPQLALSGIPYMSVGNYFSLGNSFEGPQPRTDTNMTYADNFSWIRGNHALKFGGSFEQFRVHNPFGYLNNGYYYNSGGGVYSSGDPLIDFALGIPDGYEQANDGFIDAIAQEFFGYAQDNWKASPDFTFNYGVSWDAEGPNQNRQFGGVGVVCFQISSTTSSVFPGGPPGLTYNGDPGCNEAGGPTTHYNRFAPRIGLAWSPSSGPSKVIGAAGSHDFSVRAGFGLYYNRDQEEQSLQNLVDPPVFYISHGAGDFGGSPAFANPFLDVAGRGSETNPFPFTTPSAGGKVDWGVYNFLGLAAFSPGYSVPYTYNYNLNIQRAFGADYIAQVGYVGSVSHRLASWYEGDPITPAGHAACLTNSLCTSYPGDIHLFFPQYTAQPAIVPGTAGGGYVGNGVPWYTSVGSQTTDGSSNYNSFQASLRKAPSHGLQFTASYTYSHALDDGSGYESTTGSAGRNKNYTPGFEYLNYGDSDFDARHRLATSYAYTVPVAGFMKSNLIAREALSGWEVAGVTALQTGFPVGINEGTARSLWCDNSSYFGCADNPEYSGAAIQKMSIRSATNQYFATTPFSTETLGTFGNTARNFFHGPGFDYTNLQVSKNIYFSSDRRRAVQLRLEAFNAFNHANFANPSGTFLSGSFGRVTGVDESADPNGDPSPGRSIQIAGKVFF
jgi:Carboxypeptidase regulatory-like domain/TonB dependent receptor